MLKGLLSAAIKGATGLVGGAGSLLGGAQYWLLAMAVTSVAAGAFGYYEGNAQVITKVINASNAQIAAAHDDATKAQADRDAKDFAADRADYERRLASAQSRAAALQAALNHLPKLVPHQAECKVSAEAMKSLNAVGAAQ